MKKALLNGILCAGALLLGAVSVNGQSNTYPTTGNPKLGNMTIGTRGTTTATMIGFNSTVANDQNILTGYSSELYFDSQIGDLFYRQSTTGNVSAGTAPTTYLHAWTIKGNGNVGLSTSDPTAKLHVANGGSAVIEGTLTVGENTPFTACSSSSGQPLRLKVNGIVGAKEFRCSLNGWCDYVFEDNYKLKPLNEVESFIKTNRHLPEVPSEKEVVENGMEMGEMMKVHMKKIEELTLYMIELQKQNEKLAAEVAGLKK